MSKKINWLSATFLSVLFLSGCATTRNYQPELDSLNSRITTLQGQLSEKDQEIVKLQNQLGDRQTELKQAESEKHDLTDKLSSALSKLDAASKKPVVKPEESDLK